MRRSVVVLIIGGLIGLGVGLYLGWVQFPVQTINAPLSLLSPDNKLVYIEMAAEGYQTSGDLAEATREIAQLSVPDVGIYVRQLTENMITTGSPAQATQIRALSRLAAALGQGTTLMQPYLITTATAPPATP